MRPFRFGVSAVQFASRHELRDTARRAEAGGWSTLLIPDHLGSPSSFAPLVLAADATETLRVGTFVINNDFFHPLRLAQEAATVDLLTDGRLELGLGAGWAKPEYELAGISYDKPSERSARLADAVRTMKKAWAGEVVVPGRDAPAAPAPVQSPHPPLLIGGHSDATLSIAATEADIVGLTGVTWTGSQLEPTGASTEALSERAEFVRRQAGERADQLEYNILVQVVSIGQPFEQQAEEIGARLEIPPAVLRDTPLALVGTKEEVVEKIHYVRERVGISYFAVFGTSFDQMAPVVAELAGQR